MEPDTTHSEPQANAAATDESPRAFDGLRGRPAGFAVGAVILVLLVWAVYWPALRGEFVWDDPLLVNKNPLVTGQFNLRTIWFQTDFPLTDVALWFQWQLWGAQPGGYHAVNILLHALSCVLLWRVLAQLKTPGAWTAAALFAVHPVAVMSVAWVSELKNTLSLGFVLFSFLCFLKFDEVEGSDGKPQGKRWYWLSLGAFLLALLSKTSTVMLPVVLLLLAWWRRGRVARRDWLRSAPFFLLSLVFGCMTIWLQAQAISVGDEVQSENLPGRLAGAGMALWFYFGKTILPLNLSAIYPHWTIAWKSPAVYLPTIAWAALLLTGWRWRSQSWGRAALFGLVSFTVLLFPVLGIISMNFLEISRVSDHFQYLPMIPIVALAVAALNRYLPAGVSQGAATILILACSVLSFHRAGVFARSETLWRETLARNPAAWTAHNNLGCILAARNEFNEAIDHFEASLQYNPYNASAHCNLARSLMLQKKFAAAEQHFQTALKIKFADADIQQAYAAALAQRGKMDAAVLHLREAVRLEPTVDLRLHLAGLLHQIGNSREAIEQYRQVLILQPDSGEALNNLAWLLATSPDAAMRNGTEAVRLAEKASALTGRNQARELGTLAAAYAEAGRFADAIAAASKAAELADAAGDARFATVNRQLRSLYQSGKPFHESPRNPR